MLKFQFLKRIGAVVLLNSIVFSSLTQQAMSHHGLGGETPETFLEAFLSGLAHPIIGLDHLSFVIASGAIAARQAKGMFVPLAFILAALLGTSIHLAGANLPATEIFIAASVVVFGVLLALKNISKAYGYGAIAIAGVAGIFHGYAYAEAIVGAKMTPILAYLSGFTLIQLSIAWGAFAASTYYLRKFGSQKQAMRVLGLGICAIGIAFLTVKM